MKNYRIYGIYYSHDGSIELRDDPASGVGGSPRLYATWSGGQWVARSLDTETAKEWLRGVRYVTGPGRQLLEMNGAGRREAAQLARARGGT